jgi:hypothetical protein
MQAKDRFQQGDDMLAWEQDKLSESALSYSSIELLQSVLTLDEEYVTSRESIATLSGFRDWNQLVDHMFRAVEEVVEVLGPEHQSMVTGTKPGRLSISLFKTVTIEEEPLIASLSVSYELENVIEGKVRSFVPNRVGITLNEIHQHLSKLLIYLAPQHLHEGNEVWNRNIEYVDFRADRGGLQVSGMDLHQSQPIEVQARTARRLALAVKCLIANLSNWDRETFILPEDIASALQSS